MTTPPEPQTRAGPILPGGLCPYSLKPCNRTGRHKHPYVVGTYGARRCSCGSRHYQIATGGPLPPKVVCGRCGKDNYSATCYEAGRAHGPRLTRGDDDGPSF